MKRILVLATAVLALVGLGFGAGVASAADALVIDGWALPRDHIYQVQDDRGVYYQLPPRDIPAAILRGKEVYDLTARAWVNHPTAFAATQGRNPAYTVSAQPVHAAAPAAPGDVLAIDGWALPRSHYYQAQDDAGVYHPLNVRDVPSTILRGKEVYDVTAQAWVNHPTAFAATGGRNPAYTAGALGPAAVAAPTGDVVLVEGWRLPRAHIYQVQDDRGVYYQIQPRDIPGQIVRGKEVYDLTAQAWVNHPTAFAATGGRNPAYTATAGDDGRDRGRGGRSEQPSGDWQEVRGTIERIDRDGLTLRTDDGWSFAVDLRDVSGARRLTPGERVVVIGSSSGGRFIARHIAEERYPAR